MTDTSPAVDPGQPFRLIYRSHNRIPADRRKSELGAIFSVARSQNKKADITGALLISGDWFVQALEGDETAVRSLYDHISKDRRHERVSVIDAQAVDARVFSRWSMARVSDEADKPDIPLLMNVNKGGISPAAGRPTTPDQDAVLDQMRAAARGDAKG
jgi:hypothetical protein